MPAGDVDRDDQHGDDRDADQDGEHAEGHEFHHAILRAVDAGVFLEFGFHRRQGGEHGEAENEVGDGGAEKEHENT